MASCGCGCTPVRVTMLGGRGAPGPPGEPGPAGDWTAEAQAQAQGFWLIASETEPTETEMYGVPVVWVDTSPQAQEVPVLPYEPAWRDATTEVVIPELVGVDYKMNGAVVTGTLSFTAPVSVTITAEAQPGYYMTGTFSWTHSFPDPDARVLLASDGFSGPDVVTINGRVLDNSAGGTETFTWENLIAADVLGIDTEQAVQVLNPTGRPMISVLTGTTYLRIEFDLISAPQNNAEFGVAVSGAAAQPGTSAASLLMTSGGTRVYTDGDERSPRIPGIALGRYAIQVFADGARFEIPGQSVRFHSVSRWGPRVGFQIFTGTATTPAVIDNVAIYAVG